MEEPNKKIRCFIALNFPEEILEKIEKIQKFLGEKKIFNGRFTDKKNLHLTLKFLGEISEEMISKVKERLKEMEFKNFESCLGEIGIFFPEFIKIIWIKISGKSVVDLQNAIDEALKDLFEKEKRFMSHLTIARVKNVRDKELFLREVDKIHFENAGFKVSEFYLIKSELTQNGPIYEILEKFSLK